jgi:hypothetical protein
MGKTILLPTDFTIRSLNLLRHALYSYKETSLNIVMVTGVTLPESISDLLFFSKREFFKKMSDAEFTEACDIIRKKYASNINSLRFEIFTGVTQAAFRNFLEGNDIEEIYIPQNKLNYPERCFDPIPFMQRSNLPQQLVSWTETTNVSSQNHLGELFTSWT